MEVSFDTKKMQKLCALLKAMQREWGPEMAKKLALRLNQLEDADNLEIVARSRLGRFHEYAGGAKGVLALDLVHPQRLLFRPNHDPVPYKEGNELDLAAVTRVVILGVTDPH